MTFEHKDQKTLDAIFSAWRERGVEVVKMGEIFRTFAAEYLIAGDLPHSALRKITEGIESMEGVETIDLQYSLSTSTSNKTVLLLVNVRNKAKVNEIDEYLKTRSESDDFLLIRGTGV